MFDKNIDRRQFLKLTSGGIFSSIVLNEFSPLFAKVASSGKNVSLLSREFRQGIPTFCNLCPAQCGILGFVEQDWLAGIQGNPRHPNNRGKICARGVAGLNLVHDPERLLFPLKRTGRRGEGKWTRISWQDALKEISADLNRSHQQESGGDIVFNTEERYFTGLTHRFFESLRNAKFLPSTNYADPNKAQAQMITWGEPYEIPDLEHSNYMLLFGANPFESHPFYINLSQRIIEARLNNGARLVTIDPRLSNTAGRSDEWQPIYPGTDGMVALAMANVIMQKHLYDGDFIANWTNISVAELQNYLSQFSLEQAAEISAIPATEIERIAVEFASRKPAVAISGAGVTKRQNGTQNERCVMLLNAVVGNIDKKGGFCLPRKFELNDFSPENNLNKASIDFYQLSAHGERRIQSFIACLSNPAYEAPNCGQVAQLLQDEKKIPSLIVIDHVMSETAMLADLILPAATQWEGWDLSIAPAFDLVPPVAIGQPVISPRGESMPLAEIWLRLTEMMGRSIADARKVNSIEEYVKGVAAQIPGFTANDYGQLKNIGIWLPKTKPAQYEIYKDRGFRTPSRKFEIVSSQLKNVGQFDLPRYIPIKENIQLSKTQLILIPFTSNVMPPNLANSKWLAEIRHINEAWLNPATARRLKIRNGQHIKLQSLAGEVEVEAKIFNGIHPKAIALCSGLGHWAYGKIARAKRTKSDDPDTELLWWEKHGNGVNTNLLVELKLDPIGQGPGWKDTVVEIKKMEFHERIWILGL